ncbi:MAG: DUF1573 domain-containing protein [Planctomycetota bacterium]|nr:DUF1573 domain-containing protein [Planctomycetota bacterium]
MRRIYFVFVYLIVGCALLWQSGCHEERAQIEIGPTGLKEPGEVHAADAGVSVPKIVFEKKGYDFGDVPPNKVNTGQIKFTNTGEGVLKITKVGRCCGVVATLDKDKDEYAPGESGAINVEWRSGSQKMSFARQLVVHSNDKANSAAQLTIQAKIVPRITAEPTRLRLFLDEENAGCPKVTIRSLDDRPFSITGFKSTGDCITADFDPSVEATKFVLQPQVNAEKLNKNLKGNVIVGLTHPDGNTAVFNFDVLKKYTVNPPLLIVFNAEPNEPLVRKISVLSNYEKPFDIESISSNTGAISVKVLEKKELAHGYQLQVEITPPPSEGKMRFMDELHLVLEGGEKLTIKCNGYYKKTRPAPKTQ